MIRLDKPILDFRIPNMQDCIGNIIRLNREAQNLSLSSLADIAGINVAQLSKIERGIENASEKLSICIFEALGISYEKLQKDYTLVQELFWSFYEAYFYAEEINIVEDILDEINKIIDSEYIITESLLANVIFNLSYRKNLDIASEYLSLLFVSIENIPSIYKTLYFEYYALYCDRKEMVDQAISYLNKALEISPNKVITAMIYYHLGPVYRRSHKILQAFQVLTNAKNLFLENGNYTRGCYTDLAIANVYSSNGELDEALELYGKCLENYKRLKMPKEEISVIFFNMVFVNVLKENYRQSYEIMSNLDETIQTILEKRSNYILFKIITLFELGMDDEANNWCKKIVSCFNKDDIDHNLIMYYYHVRDTKTVRMKYINCAKKLIRKNGSYSDYRLIFQILRKESTSEKQLKELNDLLYHYIFNYFE